MESNHKRVHIFLLLIVTAVLIWSVIRPSGYLIWVLEVLPAVVGCIVVLVVYHKFKFTNLSYVIIVILSILTFIGGHYTYDDVPLFNWIKDAFDLSRNHYDRFGHFFKGFIAIVSREILIRKTLLKRNWIVWLTLSISLSISALYEIIEWIYSAIRSGHKEAKQFVGMQGDIWDAQWDMSLTLIGSIIALLVLSKLHNKYLTPFRD
ncbi:putative membrane protein [Bacillus sp. OAE603]